MFWVFLWCWKGCACMKGNKGQLTGQCVLWGLCTRCRCVLGRLWGPHELWARCLVFGMDSLHCCSHSRSGWGRLTVTEVALPLQCSALSCTDVLSYTFPLQQRWPKPDQKAGILSCFPWWVFFGETSSETTFLPVHASSHPRQRQMKQLWWMPDCFTHLSPKGYYTHLVSRALWKHISVLLCSECLKEHSWRFINLNWNSQEAQRGHNADGLAPYR